MKSTFLAGLALAALVVPAMAEAHEAGPAPIMAAGNTLLTVSAEGRSARKPDLALFSAGVTSSGKTAGEALAANSADMNRVIAALKRAGIADKDIQTSQLSLNPVYAPQPPVMYARAMAAESGGAPPVAAGEVALNASVTVQFELAP